MHCTSDSEINGGIIILFPFCFANFPISSPSVILPQLFLLQTKSFTIDSRRFHISSGQGQEMVADEDLIRLPSIATGFFSKLVVYGLSEGNCPLSWRDVPRLQTKCEEGYSKSFKWLIILFFFTLNCNRINIILIDCMLYFS